MSKFNIFSEISLTHYLRSNKKEIEGFFTNMPEEKFLKTSKDECISHLVDKYKIDTSLDFENVDVQTEDVGSKDYYVFRIPFNGNNTKYFELEPDDRRLWTTKVYLEDNNLCFDIVDDNKNLEKIKQEAKKIMDNIKAQVDYVKAVIDPYNDELEDFIEGEYDKRKQRREDKIEKLDSLRKMKF